MDSFLKIDGDACDPSDSSCKENFNPEGLKASSLNDSKHNVSFGDDEYDERISVKNKSLNLTCLAEQLDNLRLETPVHLRKSLAVESNPLRNSLSNSDCSLYKSLTQGISDVEEEFNVSSSENFSVSVALSGSFVKSGLNEKSYIGSSGREKLKEIENISIIEQKSNILINENHHIKSDQSFETAELKEQHREVEKTADVGLEIAEQKYDDPNSSLSVSSKEEKLDSISSVESLTENCVADDSFKSAVNSDTLSLGNGDSSSTNFCSAKSNHSSSLAENENEEGEKTVLIENPSSTALEFSPNENNPKLTDLLKTEYSICSPSSPQNIDEDKILPLESTIVLQLSDSSDHSLENTSIQTIEDKGTPKAPEIAAAASIDLTLNDRCSEESLSNESSVKKIQSEDKVIPENSHSTPGKIDGSESSLSRKNLDCTGESLAELSVENNSTDLDKSKILGNPENTETAIKNTIINSVELNSCAEHELDNPQEADSISGKQIGPSENQEAARESIESSCPESVSAADDSACKSIKDFPILGNVNGFGNLNYSNISSETGEILCQSSNDDQSRSNSKNSSDVNIQDISDDCSQRVNIAVKESREEVSQLRTNHQTEERREGLKDISSESLNSNRLTNKLSSPENISHINLSSVSQNSTFDLDSHECFAENWNGEAGPVTAAEEFFEDPAAFDFLDARGSKDLKDSEFARKSLFVKFDPLLDTSTELKSRISQELAMADEDRREEKSDLKTVKNTTPLKNPALEAVGKLITLTPISNVASPEVTTLTPNTLSTELSKLQELLVQQEKEYKEILSKLENKVTKIENENAELDAENKKIKTELENIRKNEAKLRKDLNEKSKGKDQLSTIMVEYEKTISQLIAQKESVKEKHEAELKAVESERDTTMQHLNNLELAFSDIHLKYEKSKVVIENLKKNEDTLKASVQEYDSAIKKQETKYEMLKQHAKSQLDKVSQELEVRTKSQEAESAKLRALLKKAELRNSSLEQSLEQKTNENQELLKICDELINKMD